MKTALILFGIVAAIWFGFGWLFSPSAPDWWLKMNIRDFAEGSQKYREKGDIRAAEIQEMQATRFRILYSLKRTAQGLPQPEGIYEMNLERLEEYDRVYPKYGPLFPKKDQNEPRP